MRTCAFRSTPPYLFESEVAYDATSGPGTIATGFEGLRALDAPSGQVRAWDPAVRPQLTQQWNAFVEYPDWRRSSINLGYVGSKSKYLITPIDGNQPLPGTGDPSTWLPVQQRRPLIPLTRISRRSARPPRADAPPTTRCRRRSSSDYGTASTSSPTTRSARRCRTIAATSAQDRHRRRRRVPEGQLRHRAELWSCVVRCEAPLLDGRQLRVAVRAGADDSAVTGTGPRFDRGRLVAELRAHRAHRIPDHGHRRRGHVAASFAVSRAPRPDCQWRSGQPDSGAVDRPRSVPSRRRLANSEIRALASCARPATGTSTSRSPSVLDVRPAVSHVPRRGHSTHSTIRTMDRR